MKNTQEQLKQILEALDKKCLPHTYGNIGKELGFSRQRAHIMFFKYMPPRQDNLQPMISELMHADISNMSLQQVYVQFGKKHNLSYSSVYYVLKKNGFKYSSSNCKQELADIVNSLDTSNLSVPEILSKIIPENFNKTTAELYLYDPEYRSRHGIKVKPLRSTFSK